MALSLKRSCSSLPFSSTPRPFKKCRKVSPRSRSSSDFVFTTSSCLSSKNISSSEEEDDDSETELYDHRTERRKSMLKRRRSSTRSAAETPSNIELSRAVALYSDDEDEEQAVAELKEKEMNHQRHGSNHKKRSCSMISDGASNRNGINNINNTANNLNGDVNASARPLPQSDFVARSRCFEYLVSAIDEAWARYCDATSYAEDENYGYSQDVVNTPNSISVTDDNDEEYYSEEVGSTAETEMTDYADIDLNGKVDLQMVQLNNKQLQVKQQMSLQNLKDRLTNAKYYLQDYVEGDEFEDCVAFWKRWDMVKYCTIELVEDEDEEDVVESTIEELEKGRCSATV